VTATIDVAEADRALKASHRATWALGDYPALADELIPELGDVLTGACYGFRRWAGVFFWLVLIGFP
jgi:membrane protein required for beta-lactamase induction